jgi:prepilin-type processing-associated H-X9-DG protein
MSSYGGNAGTRSVLVATQDGVFFIDSRVRIEDIKDGTSNTLLFGERFHDDPEFNRRQPVVLPGTAPLAHTGRWGYVANVPGTMTQVTLHTAAPINYQLPSGGDRSAAFDRICAFGSGHRGGANFAFADGRVRFVNQSIAWSIFQALSTRRRGEVVGDY